MSRRKLYLIAAGLVLAGYTAAWTGAIVRAKAGSLPQSHAQLQRLFRACERAQNSAELLSHAPPSWGSLPWEFTGVQSWTDGIERPAQRTVTVTVHQVRDDFRNGQHRIHVDYRVRVPVTYDRWHTFTCLKGPGL